MAPVTPPKVAPVTPPKEVGVPGVTADSAPKKFLNCMCITFSGGSFTWGYFLPLPNVRCVCVYFNIGCLTKGRTS